MPILEKLRNIFAGSGDGKKKVRQYQYIRRDADPSELWDIIGELGDGAFGKVYKACQKDGTLEAALKQVDITDESELEEYSVEIDILSQCRHKNIVGIYESYFINSKLCMYIEFCGGGAVDSIMQELEKPLTEPQIRCICHEMCEGLEFLHQQFVIHRDLKAGNVLLTADGQVRLADFGVSAKNTTARQRRDSFIGTPYWMAPEVIMCETIKDSPYNFKADIWSFGITMIECAEVNPPNHEMHPMRVFIKIQKSSPPKLSQANRWSAEFSDFIAKCLVKDPDQRCSASDLLEHPFIRDVADMQPLVALVSEANAEVLYEEKDIDEVDELASSDTESVMDSDLESLSTFLVPTSAECSKASIAGAVADSGAGDHAQSALQPAGSEPTSRDDDSVCQQSSRDEDATTHLAAAAAAADDVVGVSSDMTSQSVDMTCETVGDDTQVGLRDARQGETRILAAEADELADQELDKAATAPDAEAPILKPDVTIDTGHVDEILIAETSAEDDTVTIATAVDSSEAESQTVPSGSLQSADTAESHSASEVRSETQSDIAADVTESREMQVEVNVSDDHGTLVTAGDVVSLTSGDRELSIVHELSSTLAEDLTLDISSIVNELIDTAVSMAGSCADDSVEKPLLLSSEEEHKIPEPEEERSLDDSGKVELGGVTMPAEVCQEARETDAGGAMSKGDVAMETVAESDSNSTDITTSPSADAAVDGADMTEADVSETHTDAADVDGTHVSHVHVGEVGEPNIPEPESSSVDKLDNADPNAVEGIEPGRPATSTGPDRDDSFAAGRWLDHVVDAGEVSFVSQDAVPATITSAVDKMQETDEVGICTNAGNSEPSQETSEPVNTGEDHSSQEISEVGTSLVTEPVAVDAIKLDSSTEVTDTNLSGGGEPACTDLASQTKETDIDASAGKSRLYAKNVTKPDARVTACVADGNVTDEANTEIQPQQNPAVTETQSADEQTETVVLRKKAGPAAESGLADGKDKQPAKTNRLKATRKTLTKTRKFVVNGVVMTSQTSKIVADELKKQQEHQLWKADLRELKRLHIQENRLMQALASKALAAKDDQTKKFEIDKQMLLRVHDGELDQLMRQNRQSQEKLSAMQVAECKALQKKLKAEQERDLKTFHEGLKQDMKLMKQSIDMLPKDVRKDMMRQRKEEKDVEQAEKERQFLERQATEMEDAMKRLSEQHREKVALYEKQYLQQKHQLKREHETAIVELEKRQLLERKQLEEKQLKEKFILQRQLLMTRQAKELDQIKRINSQKEEELTQCHLLERKRQPKILKADTKTRTLMYRESLRIVGGEFSLEEERERLRQFDEAEKLRMKQETLRLETKQTRQITELRNKNETIVKELDQVYLEKQAALLDNETQKTAELETLHTEAMDAWTETLAPRQQAMEDEFALEFAAFEKFYSSTEADCPPYPVGSTAFTDNRSKLHHNVRSSMAL